MDVRCEKCQTEYSLDETLVSPSGTAVRCTTCNHVFKAFPTGAGGVGPSNWTLRQVGGATFPFERMGVLQDWITTGKVSGNDQICRDGVNWKRLGDMPEMRPFFDAAANARAVRADVSPVAAGYGGSRPSSEHLPTVRTSAIGDAPKGVGVRPVTAPFVRQVVQGRKTDPPPPMARVQQEQHHVHATSNDTMVALDKTMSPSSAHMAATGPQGAAPTPVASVSPTANFQLDQTIRAPSAAVLSSAPTAQISVNPGPYGQPAMSSQAAAEAAMARAFEQQRTMPAGSGHPSSAPPMPVNVASSHETRRGISIHDPDFSQVPAGKKENWRTGESLITKEPAWAGADRMVDMAVEDEFAEDMPPRKRHVGRWVSLIVVVLVLGVGFYMYMFQRDTVASLLGSALTSSDDDRYMGFYLKGQESFLLDTETAFKQADGEYHQALGAKPDHAATMAGLGELYAVWAQYLLDREIDARMDAIGRAPDGALPDFAAADILATQFEQKLAEARRWSEQAIATDPELPQGYLAMADVQRLSGDLPAAETSLEKGRSAQTVAAANYVAAMLAMSENRDSGEIIGMLKSAVGAEPLVRALYREARLRAADGNIVEARGVLAKVRALNSDHDGAATLTGRLDEGLPIALVLPTSAKDGIGLGVDAGEGDVVQPSAETLAKDSTQKAAGGGGAGGGGGGGFVGGSVESMLVKATKLQNAGNQAEAQDLFEQALEREPSNVDALSGLGYCHLGRRAYGPAIATFRRALGVSPSYGPATIGLADAFRKQGQKEQALKYYEQYVVGHATGGDAYRAKRAVEELTQELAAAGAGSGGGGDDESPGTSPAGEEGSGGASPGGEKPPVESAPTDEKPAPDSPAPAASPTTAQGESSSPTPTTE